MIFRAITWSSFRTLVSDREFEVYEAQRNYELDDVNKSSLSDSDNFLASNWNAHSLEELDLDNNHLVELPAQLFQLKSLRYLEKSFL